MKKYLRDALIQNMRGVLDLLYTINHDLVIKTKKARTDIAFYFSQALNKPFVRPDVLQLTVTTRCNLRCKTCNIYEHSSKPEEELSINEMKPIIRQAYFWGIPTLSILGGEPLLRSDIIPLIEYAKKFGMEVQITTNATLITKELADKLVDLGVDSVSMSLDGSTAELHDKIRGIKGTFSRAVHGIKTLVYAKQHKKSKKPWVSVGFTLENENCSDLNNFLKFAKRIGVNSITYMPYVQDISNMKLKSDSDLLWIPAEKIGKLKSDLKKIDSFDLKDFVYKPKSFYLIPSYFQRELKPHEWKCFVGFMRFNVAPDGNVMMCGDVVGNVREEKNIISIWESKKAQAARINAINCTNPCIQDCLSRPDSDSISKIAASVLEYTSSIPLEEAREMRSLIIKDIREYENAVFSRIMENKKSGTGPEEKEQKRLIDCLTETKFAIDELSYEDSKCSKNGKSRRTVEENEARAKLRKNERELLTLKKSKGYKFIIKPISRLFSEK
jgi:MoaA/NifB/PqqE/SkfB family radical SAM enzyme